MHDIDTAAEAYLEPFQTYMMEAFCENCWKLKALKCFQERFIIDSFHSSNHGSKL